MRMNKCAYLFAAALVASTVGMTSCSNEDVAGIENIQGQETKIALGMSVALPVQTKAATTADEVNFGAGVADIQNVTIVPMVKNAIQNPIVLGLFDADDNTTHFREATVLNTVDGFRVYGNLPSAPSENKVFVMPSLAQGNTEDNPDVTVTDLKKPHALYYYTESTSSNANKFKVATGSKKGDWNSASFQPIGQGAAIGTNNRIQIPGVTYAVGVFSAAVKDEIVDAEGNLALTGNIFSVDGASPTKSWQTVKGEGGKTIDVTGLIIEGQTADFDATLNPKSGSGEVKVYSKAVTPTLSTGDISFDGQNKVANANIYTVVAPEDAENITINFQFQNNTGYTLHLKNGDKVADKGYFYLPAVLDKGEDQNIFAAATSTLINARVKDWGKGVTEPAETVDLEIGVVVDTQWKKGIAFDEEI